MTHDTVSRHSIPLMAGQVEIALYDMDATLAEEIVLAAHDEGLRLQRIFNFFDPRSELSRLNRERKMTASKELRDVVRMALEYCALTDGRYDISLGKQFLQRKRGQEVTPVGCTYKDIFVEGGVIELGHPDVLVDLGSIAKGYIADRLTAFIVGMGAEGVFIDARGDMRIAGPHQETILVQHPRDPLRTLRPFTLQDMAVATSGDYKQYTGSFDKSHIINAKDIASATIVAPTLVEADAIASAVFVSGVDGAQRIMDGVPYAKALLIATDGREIALNGFEELETAPRGKHAAKRMVQTTTGDAEEMTHFVP